LRDLFVLVFEGKVLFSENGDFVFEFLGEFFDVDGEEGLSLSFN